MRVPADRPRPPDDEALVVLVPGLGLDARSWDRVRALLPGESDVVTLPSVGRRAPRGSDLTVEELGRRLVAALPVGRRLVLVGLSVGCPVVVEAASRTSAVVGLVLVGPVTDPTASTWPRMLGQWARTAVHESLWELGVLAPQYRATGLVSMARGMNQLRRYRTDLALGRMPVPTRVIRGAGDRIASQRWCEQLAGPSAPEVLCVPGAGHMVPLTHPHVVADCVEALRGTAAVRRG